METCAFEDLQIDGSIKDGEGLYCVEKHLQCWVMMAFICWQQMWWRYGSSGRGLRSQLTDVALSIITPFECSSWDPTCVALDWLVAWEEVMEPTKIIVVLCWWVVVVLLFNFSRCLKNVPKKLGYRIPLPFLVGKALFEEAVVSSPCFIKNSTMACIVFLWLHPLIA